MQTTEQTGGTAKNRVGQDVETGRPHQPLPNERKRQQDQTGEKIDMNPGEPARPYVGGDEPQQAGTR